MNSHTAQHLNSLHAYVVSPLALIQDGRDGDTPAKYRLTGNGDISAVYDFIERCRVRVAPAAIAEEIRNAARERRDADTYTGDRDNSLIYWGQVNGHSKYAGGIALAMCIDQIRAEIDRMNAVYAAQYEVYRIACEQGVAVPPASATR